MAERVEYPRLFLRRNADPGIAHPQAQAHGIRQGLLHSNANFHFAFLGKLDGIAYQIDHHLAQAARIADQAVGDIRGDVAHELYVFARRVHGQCLHGIAHFVAQAELDLFQRQAACFDSGKVENVVEQGQQGFCRLLHQRQVVALLRFELGAAQELGHADDAVHWSTDFVAHIGQERTFGLVGRFGLLLGTAQSLLRLFECQQGLVLGLRRRRS